VRIVALAFLIAAPAVVVGLLMAIREPAPVGRSNVRVVLDTHRVNGWNEIDSVELVGPDGRAWATSATASSIYGQ